ncbi:MAG: osmotically inducible protein C [Deltaproteobacteria bacterium SG8_13]|nr:MAG: osmotically inducible protein C [Deltaproteobacteria bacterium SG8_13]
MNSVVNGVNVDELFGTIDAIKSAPVIGKFKFKAGNKWINGGLNRTTIQNFYGAQKELSHKQPFVLDADEPPLLLGEDQGPNPVEYALTALAACVTTSIVYHAAAKGIELRSVESRLEGDIDLRGFLGISEDVSPGYEEIRMVFKIDSGAPAEAIDELIRFAPNLSPVYRTITGKVPVSVKLEA